MNTKRIETLDSDSARPAYIPETAEEILLNGIGTGIFADLEHQDRFPGNARDVTFYDSESEQIGHGYYSDYDSQWHGTWDSWKQGEDAVGGHDSWDELGVALSDARQEAEGWRRAAEDMDSHAPLRIQR